MAIRHREGRKKPWEVYWNNPFTFKRESLCVETKEEAQKQDALKKYQLKFERDLFRPAEEEAVQVEQTLESAFYLYLKERQLSQKSFRSILEAMGASLRFYGQKPVMELTATDLKMLKEHLSTMGTRGTTVRRRLCVLRTVLRWCEANSLIPAVPSFPPLPSANYEKFIPPTQEEISRIFTCAAQHIQRVIVLGTQCGVRIGPSELLKIKWSDVDLNHSVIHVPAAKKNIHEPWRDVPIKSECFLSLRNGCAMTPHVGRNTLSIIKGGMSSTSRWHGGEPSGGPASPEGSAPMIYATLLLQKP